jgi:hypothetical protein
MTNGTDVNTSEVKDRDVDHFVDQAVAADDVEEIGRTDTYILYLVKTGNEYNFKLHYAVNNNLCAYVATYELNNESVDILKPKISLSQMELFEREDRDQILKVLFEYISKKISDSCDELNAVEHKINEIFRTTNYILMCDDTVDISRYYLKYVDTNTLFGYIAEYSKNNLKVFESWMEDQENNEIQMILHHIYLNTANRFV